MSHRITLIPGDGVGPEITAATRRVIEAAGVSIEWEEAIAGEAVFRAGDSSGVPQETADSITRTGVALKGPLGTLRSLQATPPALDSPSFSAPTGVHPVSRAGSFGCSLGRSQVLLIVVALSLSNSKVFYLPACCRPPLPGLLPSPISALGSL